MFYSFILGLIFLYLYTIYPGTNRKDKMDAFLNIHYAHRGLFDNNTQPENTLSAFQLALDKGYGIEFDVRMTKDNIPIVVHDLNLFRVCGEDLNVSDLSFKDLQVLNLFSTNEKIPLLEDVLTMIDGKVPIIVEIKLNSGNDTSICEIITPLLDNYNGDYAVESFNPMILLWYKKNRPHVTRGQLSFDFFKENGAYSFINFLMKNLMLNFLTKPDFVAYDHRDRNNLSLLINKKIFKVPLVAYTIKSQSEYEKSKGLFDIFIFDSFLLK